MIRPHIFLTLISCVLAFVFSSNVHADVIWSDDFSSGTLSMDYPGGKAGPDYVTSVGTYDSVSADGNIGVSAPSLKLDNGGQTTSGHASIKVTLDQFAPFTVGPLSATPFLRVSFDFRIGFIKGYSSPPEVYFALTEGFAAGRTLRIGYGCGSLSDADAPPSSDSDLALFASRGTASVTDSTAIGLVPGIGWLPSFDFGQYITNTYGGSGQGTKQEFYRVTFLYNSITGAVTGHVTRLLTGESAPLPSGLSLAPGTTFSSDDLRDEFRFTTNEPIDNWTYVDNIVFEALSSGSLTEPPLLLAPADGTRTGSPVRVSFSLPENALPGSVKLSFGGTILTLAATQEVAGLHSFSFDPANPAASPEIASATGPVADGSYRVTLLYQDADGSPVSSDTSREVTIYTVARPEVIWSDDFSSGTLSMDYPGGKAGPDYVLGYEPSSGYGFVSADGAIGLSAPSLKLHGGGGTAGYASAQVTMDQFAPFTVGPLSATPFLRGSFDLRVETFDKSGFVTSVVYFYLTEGSGGDRTLTIGYTYYTLNDGDVHNSLFGDLTLYSSPIAGGQPDSMAIGLVPGTGWLPGFDFGNIYLGGNSVGGSTKHEFYRIRFLYNSITGAVTGRVTRLSTGESAPLPSGLSLTPGTTFSSDDVRDRFGFAATASTSSDTYVDNIVFEALSSGGSEPPVLIAPAGGTRTSSPVTVSFTLPENALPGSVKLSFGETILTLAATQQSAGSHSFSFDPANPTASPEIAGATGPVADGSYLVTLSYQDGDVNPAASDTSSEVTIDRVTLPPVLLAPAANTTPELPVQVSYTLPEAPKTGTVKLAFGPHVLTLSALGETFGGGGATFNFDPANPTASPYVASGQTIPRGAHTVTLSYQDALGNPVASDTSTQVTINTPPVLLAPVANTTTSSPVYVNYTLPEAPKTGTVKLAFGPHVLTVSALGETSGSAGVAFNFDPANPTASSYIASGSPIPDGVYAVTLSYQDAQGNVVASGTNSEVKIDTVTLPPVLLAPAANTTLGPSIQVNYTLPKAPEAGTVKLAFGPHVLTLSALGEVFGGESVAFVFDPASPTASPYIASGSPIPDGVYAVTLSYQDDLGNTVVSATNVNVTIDAVPNNPTNTVLYGEGSEVPASAGLPVEAVWRKFGVPAVNAAGDVVFTAEWADATGRGASVFGLSSIASELRAIIRRGAPVPEPGPGAEPPPAGAVVAKLRDPIVAANGDVLTPVVLAGKGINATNDAALVWSPRSNPANARLVVREGQLIPGGRVKAITAAEVGNAGVAFTATLVGKGINGANDFVACVWTPLGGVVPVAREAQDFDGSKLKHFNALGTWGSSPGQGRGMALLDNAPLTLGLFGKFNDGRSTVLALEPGETPQVFTATDGALFGPPAGGGTFKTLGLPAWAGQLTSPVYLGTLTGGTKGIFQYNADTNTSQPVAVIGAEIESNLRLKTAKDPVVSSDGTSKGWVGTIKGPKVTAANDQVIAFADGANLSIVAREGTSAVDAPEGARWKSFQSLAMPARGPLFLGSLQRGPGRITSANDVGVWGMDSSGALHCLFREGDMIAGKKLKTHTVLKAVSGTPGVTRAWNDAGQVVWLATFTDGSTAIIKTQVP